MTIDGGRDVFTAIEIRRFLDALQLARPDISEAIEIIRVAFSLQSPFTSNYTGGSRGYNKQPFDVDGDWRRIG